MYSYRGLGLNCPGDPGCPGNVQGDVSTVPDVQQQIADVWAYLWAPQPASTGGGSQTMVQWLNANGGKVAIGAAVFFGVVMLAKAGR